MANNREKDRHTKVEYKAKPKSIAAKLKAKEAELISLKNQLNETAVMVNESSTQEKVSDLKHTLAGARGSSLLIWIKGYPDPDNIASALALRWIAAKYEIQTTIMHYEKISHHENRALVKKIDIGMIEYSDTVDMSSFDYYAVNDSQSPELPVELPEACKLLVFVDHHKTLGNVKSTFLDIRENYGSNAAIYSEYLKHEDFQFSGETEEEKKIATALMHGVRSDTDNFVNATSFDYAASQFLSQHLDRDLLALISKQSIPGKTMDLTQIALQRKDVRGTFMFAGVGYVRDEDRDGIGQSADYLLQREGIETVVNYGIVDNKFIDGSLRTKSHTVDPDKWIKEVFGKDENGNYYGGGRKDKGGFQIPLGVFTKCSDKELLWILIKKTIDELLYEKIGVEENSILDND